MILTKSEIKQLIREHIIADHDGKLQGVNGAAKAIASRLTLARAAALFIRPALGEGPNMYYVPNADGSIHLVTIEANEHGWRAFSVDTDNHFSMALGIYLRAQEAQNANQV